MSNKACRRIPLGKPRRLKEEAKEAEGGSQGGLRIPLGKPRRLKREAKEA